MRRDDLGICLTKSMLSHNMASTFTHVRAYEADLTGDDVTVIKAYPQMSGEELMESMKHSKRLFWRAEFCCHPDN
ncbi:hypothetical protein [Vibrio sp.]|uniref:hypothetical protein n=1 Tax=Vibrio sp. TaxID=678 RepID=UPI003D1387EC